MALKFATTSSLVEKPVVGCSEEALIESIENVAAAAEALYEAGADGAELCQVMDNLNLAMTAIENGGLTPELLATFNSEGELSACCGQENLTAEGLEGLADKQVEALEAKYVEGLEGKMAEYWNKFVAWLKNLWAKIVNWFKNILVNRAKYVKALEPVAKMTEWDGSAKVSTKGLWKDSVNAKTAAYSNTLAGIAKNIATAVSTTNQDKADDLIAQMKKAKEFSGLEAILDGEAKEEQVSKMFSDLNQFKKTVAAHIKEAKSNNFQAVTTNIDKGFKSLIAKAGKAGNLEGDAAKDAKERVNAERGLLTTALEAIRLYNRAIMAQGAELFKIYKAANKAPKKETK